MEWKVENVSVLGERECVSGGLWAGGFTLKDSGVVKVERLGLGSLLMPFGGD